MAAQRQDGSGSGNNATISTVDEPKIELPCQFNPSGFTLSKTNSWAEPKTLEATEFQFTTEGLRRIDGLTLWFDTYEQDKAVTTLTDQLREMMRATVGGKNNTKPRPPHVVFTWGQYRSFTCVVTSVAEEYKLFFADGRPARSQVKVSLLEVPMPQTGQNPTSRAAGARRVYTVQLGDTLDWIASTELGDAGAWRSLAEANDVDDPRRLRPGQRLFIPSTL